MSRLSCVQSNLWSDYRAFKVAYVPTIVRSKLHKSRLSCVQNCICPDYRAFIFFPDRVTLDARRHLVRSFRSGHITLSVWHLNLGRPGLKPPLIIPSNLCQLFLLTVVRIVHSTPSVTFNVTYLDEHSANISIWSNTNHFFELNASDTECEDGADGSGGPSSSCNIQVHARVPSGGVAATVDGIPSGVGRQISISSVNYDDEAGDSGVISDTFAITICTSKFFSKFV